MEGRSAMSLASFYDHYLTCTMGFGQTYADSFIDIFSIADMIHKLCKYVKLLFLSSLTYCLLLDSVLAQLLSIRLTFSYIKIITCRDDCIPQEWDGLELPSGTRIEPKLVQTDVAKVPRLREDFDDIRNILTLVYYSRPSNGRFLQTGCKNVGSTILLGGSNMDAPHLALDEKSGTV